MATYTLHYPPGHMIVPLKKADRLAWYAEYSYLYEVVAQINCASADTAAHIASGRGPARRDYQYWTLDHEVVWADRMELRESRVGDVILGPTGLRYMVENSGLTPLPRDED